MASAGFSTVIISYYTGLKDLDAQLQKASNPRGLAVIVTNDYIGTPNISSLPHIHNDGRAMEEAFRGLNFVTHWGRNLTRDQMLQLIASIKTCHHPHSEAYKCIAVVYSGHGGAGDVLLSQDRHTLCVKSDLMEALTNDPNIARIPKLFFIDACRGSDTVTAIYGAKDASVDESTEMLAKGFQDKMALLEGNFLTGYATIDLKLSYLNKHGSVWMQMLASELKQSSGTLSIQDIMATTTRNLMMKYSESSLKPQQPETVDRLNCGPLHLCSETKKPQSQPRPVSPPAVPPTRNKLKEFLKYLWGGRLDDGRRFFDDL